MDRLRMLHSLLVVGMMIGLLAWAITLWQRGAATTGDVVLVCTLGFSILQATRELAYAFVDVSQHMARLAEALATLLLPQEIRDRPARARPRRSAGRRRLRECRLRLSGRRQGLRWLRPRASTAGQRVGLVGEFGRRQVDDLRPAAALLRSATPAAS